MGVYSAEAYNAPGYRFRIWKCPNPNKYTRRGSTAWGSTMPGSTMLQATDWGLGNAHTRTGPQGGGLHCGGPQCGGAKCSELLIWDLTMSLPVPFKSIIKDPSSCHVIQGNITIPQLIRRHASSHNSFRNHSSDVHCKKLEGKTQNV